MSQCMVEAQPGRIAYIDECGSYGFDFEKEGTSTYYVLCAIIVKNDNINKVHAEFDKVKKNNGLANTELKSSGIDDTRRLRIMNQLLHLDFRIALFIADKKKFKEGSPLTEYKKSFIKFLNQHLYNLLYSAYPRLKILQDETGWPEFQESFKKYVEDHRPDYNLFNQYDFDMVNSKDEVLIQLADFIGGSITKSLLGKSSVNYIEMLQGKITTTEYFPFEHEPYWGRLNPVDCNYNSNVFSIAIKSVNNFISKYEGEVADERKMQIAVLRYLKMYVFQIDPKNYVYSDELIRIVYDNTRIWITKNTLFRKVIAQLRDEGVILASCNKGYKIPVSVEDLMTYLNQTMSIVGPMIQRMDKCRKLVKQGTDGNLDLFDDPALTRLKRYFDEKT